MRKLIALLAVAGLLVAAATAFAATKTVSWKVGSSTTQKIHKGQTVKWVWSDGQPHNVSGPGGFSRVVSKKGTTFTKKFTKRGTFKYICQVHSNMKTTVKV